ncbi:hypothetical protein ADIS_0081 [Lunatimonas lonarensis]|uniref:Uncharacterized protein n=1 Tax=Lunatimonas lonarensis TaxID=1232681 RepID=R7ZZ70_9BACT|nr:hypothetical protein ADIS_0081 [Lunatimonas lonarensis]
MLYGKVPFLLLRNNLSKIMRKPIRITLVLPLISLLLVAYSHGLLAQNYLVLQKGENQKTRIQYQVGESITYKLKDIPYYMTDIIREIQSEHLLFGENIVAPWQIEVIDVSAKDERNSTLRNLTLLPAAAALLLLTAETVNSLYADGRVEISQTSLVISGGLLGSALIMSQVRYRKFRLKGRRKLLVLSQEDWTKP